MPYIGSTNRQQTFPVASGFWSGDGSTTIFTLSEAATNDQSVQIFIDGVKEDTNSYAVSGTSVTFDVAPVSGTNNIEYHIINAVAGTFVPATGSVTPSMTTGMQNVIQVVNTTNSAVATTTTLMPYDDTIPQNTEGAEVFTAAITPTSASNILKIEVTLHAAGPAGGIQVGLFQDSTASALATGSHVVQANQVGNISFTHYMVAGTTSATTFKIRAGSNVAGTVTFNGVSGGRLFGGTIASSITITEYKA